MFFFCWNWRVRIHGAMFEQSSRRPPLCSMMCHVYTYVPECSHSLHLKCSIICVLQSAWYEHFVGQITCISHVSSARWCFFSVGTGGYGYTVLCLSNPAAAPHYVPWCAMYTHMCLKCSHCLRLKCSIICVLQSAWYEHFVGQITCISHVSSARWCSMLCFCWNWRVRIHGAMSEQSSRRPPLCSMMCHVYTYVPEMFTLFTSEM